MFGASGLDFVGRVRYLGRSSLFHFFVEGLFRHRCRIRIIEQLLLNVLNPYNVRINGLLFEFTHYSLVHTLPTQRAIESLLNQLALAPLTVLQFGLIDSLHRAHLVSLFQLVRDSLFLLLDVRASLQIQRLLRRLVIVK